MWTINRTATCSILQRQFNFIYVRHSPKETKWYKFGCDFDIVNICQLNGQAKLGPFLLFIDIFGKRKEKCNYTSWISFGFFSYWISLFIVLLFRLKIISIGLITNPGEGIHPLHNLLAAQLFKGGKSVFPLFFLLYFIWLPTNVPPPKSLTQNLLWHEQRFALGRGWRGGYLWEETIWIQGRSLVIRRMPLIRWLAISKISIFVCTLISHPSSGCTPLYLYVFLAFL